MKSLSSDLEPMYFPTCLMAKDRIIDIKFHNYSYEVVARTVIVNSYKNVQNCYQIVKITVY